MAVRSAAHAHRIQAVRGEKKMRHFPLWWVVHTDEEKERLRKSISKEGVKEPVKITRIGGIILDGNMRYEIARELGIEVPFTYASFSDLFSLTIQNLRRLFRVLCYKMKRLIGHLGED
ncbi:MAG: hypothetical protein H5T49_06475 [Hadesarchaea archaeon]|nr:hypothetical protein [Hadesarchaea archaeon]